MEVGSHGDSLWGKKWRVRIGVGVGVSSPKPSHPQIKKPLLWPLEEWAFGPPQPHWCLGQGDLEVGALAPYRTVQPRTT